MTTRKTTARFGPLAVNFIAAQFDSSPAPVMFTAPLQLSETDLAAALYRFLDQGGDSGELEDPATVREIVADQIVNAGLDTVHAVYALALRFEPFSTERALLHECRAIVGQVFGAVLDAPATRPALLEAV